MLRAEMGTMSQWLLSGGVTFRRGFDKLGLADRKRKGKRNRNNHSVISGLITGVKCKLSVNYDFISIIIMFTDFVFIKQLSND